MFVDGFVIESPAREGQEAFVIRFRKYVWVAGYAVLRKMVLSLSLSPLS